MDDATPFPARHKPTAYAPDTPLAAIATELLSRPESRSVYVVDAGARPVGVITLRRLVSTLAARVGAIGHSPRHSAGEIVALLGGKRAKDVMLGVEPFVAGGSMKDALRLLDEQEVDELPVVDEEGQLVGEIRGSELLRSGLELFKPEGEGTA